MRGDAHMVMSGRLWQDVSVLGENELGRTVSSKGPAGSQKN